MALKDSFDKIVFSYFSSVTDEEFRYKDIIYVPKKIKVSPLILRNFDCPPMCAACCPVFSLDYLPFEEKPKNVVKRHVSFNGKPFLLFSDLQLKNNRHHCRYVNKKGRCSIHKINPFSCDFELLRFIRYTDPTKPNILIQRLYGRAWNMLRVDGVRGALCKQQPIADPHKVKDEVVQKLRRLKQWCEYFEIENKMQLIINTVKNIKIYKGLI